MDEINKIKKAHRDGESINKISERFNRSWATVKKIIDTPLDKCEIREKRSRRSHIITPEVQNAIEAHLIEEEMLHAKKKQRYTAAVLYKKLSESKIYHGSRRRLQDAVKIMRRKRGQLKPKSYLPLHFPLGTTAQFDHGECDLNIDNQRLKAYLFVCSVPGAALRYCQVFPVKSSEAWGEFHERAYRFFGGVFPVSVYDNDSVLVEEILGSERRQTNFSLALEEHYQMRSKFCNPASGNEKGAVENAVGYCRRNYLACLPSFSCWKDANKQLEHFCRESIKTATHYKSGRPLVSIFEEVAQKLTPLRVFHTWSQSLEVKVDSCQLVHINSHSYSVPERFVGAFVRISLGIFTVEIFSEHTRIAQHERQFGESSCSFSLDHYLDQLRRKPGAFWDCQAVQQHDFYPELLNIWKLLKQKHPQREANRKFIEILLLIRRYGTKRLMEALKKATALNISEPEAIENIAIDLLMESFEDKNAKAHYDTWTCNVQQYLQLTEEVSL